MLATLRDEYTQITFTTAVGDERFPLNMLLRESGSMGARREMVYRHAVPDHDRIFIMLAGRAVVQMNGRRCSLQQGHAYLLPICQSFQSTYMPGCRFLYFHFNLQRVRGRDVFQGMTSVLRLNADVAALEEITANYTRDGIDAVLRWQSALFQLVCRFSAGSMLSNASNVRTSRRYDALMRYVQEQCRPSLTVQELAEHTHTSRAALSKSFRRHVGMPLKQYLVQVVMDRARALLSDTNDSIRQIAYTVGYEDPYYFCRVFKKQMRETPLQYRKATRQAKLVQAV